MSRKEAGATPLLFVAYAVALSAGVLWSRSVDNSTVFWAANGVLTGGLLLLGPRVGWTFVAACISLDLLLRRHRGAGADLLRGRAGSRPVATLPALRRHGLLGAAAYDAILMAVRMPGMDGLDATRDIRASGGPSADAPIFAVTADVMRDDVERCRAAGMNGHVPKPIKPARLMTSLMAVLQGGEAFPESSAAPPVAAAA